MLDTLISDSRRILTRQRASMAHLATKRPGRRDGYDPTAVSQYERAFAAIVREHEERVAAVRQYFDMPDLNPQEHEAWLNSLNPDASAFVVDHGLVATAPMPASAPEPMAAPPVAMCLASDPM